VGCAYAGTPLDGVGDVELGEGVVLECADQALVRCRVGDRGPLNSESFALVSIGVEQDLQSNMPARSKMPVGDRGPSNSESFALVSIGVEQDFHSNMRARSKMPMAYWCW
jgi:hypothetical protein